ncbi:MAG: hypothetical protein LUE94_10805 [Clostridiales bacterium]|nr:hypothetical protein [Clostridiales bacterium]
MTYLDEFLKHVLENVDDYTGETLAEEAASILYKKYVFTYLDRQLDVIKTEKERIGLLGTDAVKVSPPAADPAITALSKAKIKHLEDGSELIDFANHAAERLSKEDFQGFLSLFDDVRGTGPDGIRLALQGLDADRPAVKIDNPFTAGNIPPLAELYPYRDGSGVGLDYFLKTDGVMNDFVLSVSFEKTGDGVKTVFVDLRVQQWMDPPCLVDLHLQLQLRHLFLHMLGGMDINP